MSTNPFLTGAFEEQQLKVRRPPRTEHVRVGGAAPLARNAFASEGYAPRGPGIQIMGKRCGLRGNAKGGPHTHPLFPGTGPGGPWASAGAKVGRCAVGRAPSPRPPHGPPTRPLTRGRRPTIARGRTRGVCRVSCEARPCPSVSPRRGQRAHPRVHPGEPERARNSNRATRGTTRAASPLHRWDALNSR